ncbi:MAG: hypothetical protein ACYST6_16610 [Planctomycetota bacterium]|jgi:uncharacterized protein YyaL (SSP411 family)
MTRSPTSLTAMLVALDFSIGPTQEIVIAGDPEQADTKEMLKLLHRRFLPRAVILFHATGDAGKSIEKQVPFLEGQVAIDGKATAYVCENYVCGKPVNSVRELKALLDATSKARPSGSKVPSAKKANPE